MKNNDNIPELKIPDIRTCRPVAVRIKSNNSIVMLNKCEKVKVGNTEFIFARPNNVAICLIKAQKDLSLAINIYKSFIEPKINENNKIVDFIEKEITPLYDYFKSMESAVLHYYTALESFANLCIPENYTYEIINNKRVKEIWNKESIERWMQTSQKLSEILPQVFSTGEIKKHESWSNFKKLEEIRNEIIHQKSLGNMRIFKELLDTNIFKILNCVFDILDFFCDSDPDNILIPQGFGRTSAAIIDEVNEWKEHFTLDYKKI